MSSDPILRAMQEDRDLVGLTMSPLDSLKFQVAYTAAVRVALIDLCEQLDALHGRQIEPE
jgi:hypothetical protein